MIDYKNVIKSENNQTEFIAMFSKQLAVISENNEFVLVLLNSDDSENVEAPVSTATSLLSMDEFFPTERLMLPPTTPLYHPNSISYDDFADEYSSNCAGTHFIWSPL